MKESSEKQKSPRSIELAGRIVRVVDDALKLHSAPVDAALLREVEGLDSLLKEIAVLRDFSLSMARGELDYETPHRGVIIGALKNLQSNLRHLTWRTQRIASGDLDAQVNFLGQFSDAFNSMAAHLKTTLGEKEKLTIHYKDLSERDPLTRLYNRSAFQEEAARLLTSELFRERSSALILSDIDHFKRINDTFGHQCGDEVLRRVSGLFRAGLRQEDIVCRYGGEEFLILAPGISAGVAREIAQRLGDAVRGMHIIWEGSPVTLTASFGLCALPPLGENGFTLRFLREHVQIADSNLYRAKHGGRDLVVGGECDDADVGAGRGGPEN